MIPIRKQIINNKQKGMCQNWHLPFFAQSPDFRKPGYNLQTGAENQFIIDFRLFPNPTDTLTLIPFFHSFQHRYNRLPDIGVADSGYGSEEIYRFMQESGIEAFVKYNYFHKE